MYDQFDKKLSDRIKYVFDSYEDDSADAGWEQLRSNFPVARKRRRAVYWLSAAAAILVVFAATIFLYQQTGPADEMLVNTRPAVTTPQTEQLVTEQPDTEPAQPDISEPLSAERPQLAAVVPKRKARTSVEPASASVSEQKQALNTLTLVEAPMNPAAAAMSVALALKADSASLSAKQPAVAYAMQQSKEPVSAPVNTGESALERLAREEGPLIEKQSKKSGSGGISFGVYAGSFVSYSEGSKSSMNTGVGLSSEIDITSKLKISTGIALAQNTLKYDRMIPQQAAEVFNTTSIAKSDVLLSANPQAKFSASNYSINGYDASLLGFDIPVNLKYMLRDDKQEIYVVAGVSSNIFIDETYTYNYEYNTREVIGVFSMTEEEELNRSSSFDFARMLNFSVGFGYPLGKQSKLSFEPFVKYPLGGLGAQDLRFGSAGLNLKFNFSKK